MSTSGPFWTAIILAAASSSVGAAELPLKPGTYVDVGYACADWSEATAINYLGGMFHSGGTITASQKIIKRAGSTYTLAYTLIDNTTNTSEDLKETVTVLKWTSFSLETKYGKATYRWCNKGGPL